MGSNITRQKRRGEFMKLPLGDVAGWHFMIRCSGCTDDRFVPIGTLIQRYGPTPLLGNLVPRLRCRFRACRRTPATVKLHSSLDPGAVCVVLVGPGAY